MGDSLRYMDWFEKAAQDLRGAEILMAHEGGNDLVAFHCQQAMGKALKGWLLKNTGGTPGRTQPRVSVQKSHFHRSAAEKVSPGLRLRKPVLH